jgi:hypothetical protein
VSVHEDLDGAEGHTAGHRPHGDDHDEGGHRVAEAHAYPGEAEADQDGE